MTNYEIAQNSLGSILTLAGTTIMAALVGSLPTKVELIHTGILTFETLAIGFFGTMFMRWATRKVRRKIKL